MKYFLSVGLCFSLISFSFAQNNPILAWGIGADICTKIGGDYDAPTELSAWTPVLRIANKAEDKLSGSMSSGTYELQFDVSAKKDKSGVYMIDVLSLQSADRSFIFKIKSISATQYQIELKGNQLTNTYTLDTGKVSSKNLPKLITGSSKNDSLIMTDKGYFLLPILSYKLGAAGIVGNKFPIALAIHRLAYSIAGERDIVLRTITTDNRMVPLNTTNSNNSCAGRQVASPCEECWGRCGPKCECWDWACGDCCCHKGCLDHDEWCSCHGTAVCVISSPAAPLNCAPCNVPNGDLPCTPGSCGCPTGQTWCVHTQRCQLSGSLCRPACGPTQTYCERLQRCVSKAQCIQVNDCARSSNCPPEHTCYRGRCVAY